MATVAWLLVTIHLLSSRLLQPEQPKRFDCAATNETNADAVRLFQLAEGAAL
jgi:hypothetical protein